MCGQSSLLLCSRHFFNEDPGHCGPPCVCVSKCMAIIAVSNPESPSHFSLVNVIAVSFNVTVTVKVFVSCCFHMVRAMQFYQESYTQCHWMWNTNEYSCCTCHRKQSKGYQRSRHGEPFVYNSSWTDSSAARKTERVACVAWRFWLGALSNKGGQGQRNREEIGAGATWKTACTDGGHFWVGPYASVRIVPIRWECSPVNQIFW